MTVEYYSILGVSPGSSPEEIRQAYFEKMSYWQGLSSHPTRKAEAERMKARLDEAYEALVDQLDTGEGTLAYSETSYSGPGATTSKIDKNACPNCKYRGNPTDARYCINCQSQLFQICPSCKVELPWHQKVCHRCGVDIEEERQRQADEERRRKEQQVQEELHRKQAEQQAAMVQKERSRRNRLGCLAIVAIIAAAIVFTILGQRIRLNNTIANLNGTYIEINQRALPSDGSVGGATIRMWGPVSADSDAEPSEPEYYADIHRVSFTDTEIRIDFEARGASDLLLPLESCLVISPMMDRIEVKYGSFPVDTPGHYVGTVVFPIDLLRPEDNRTFYFLYGCMYEDVELFSRYELIGN